MATLSEKSIKGFGISGYTTKMVNFLKKKNIENEKKTKNIKKNHFINLFKHYIVLIFLIIIKLKCLNFF